MTALYILLASHIFLKIYNIIGKLAVSEPALAAAAYYFFIFRLARRQA